MSNLPVVEKLQIHCLVLAIDFKINLIYNYIILKHWEKAILDCKHALELDSSAVKAHFFCGQAFLEQNMHDEAISSLMRGLLLQQ